MWLFTRGYWSLAGHNFSSRPIDSEQERGCCMSGIGTKAVPLRRSQYSAPLAGFWPKNPWGEFVQTFQTQKCLVNLTIRRMILGSWPREVLETIPCEITSALLWCCSAHQPLEGRLQQCWPSRVKKGQVTKSFHSSLAPGLKGLMKSGHMSRPWKVQL